MPKNWNRNELITAFNLYCKTPFSKINARNKGVIELASIIHRTPSSVALKLANLARFDPALQERHIAGMRHGSKAEADIWNEFNSDWERLAFLSERILANYKNETIEKSAGIPDYDIPKEGKERESLIRTRVNQSFFRRTILASYDNRCCIMGISIPELLVASHIIPWSVDKKNRMNPCNGLCLNVLHDKAFDTGLFTINQDYSIRLSKTLKQKSATNEILFIPYESKKINLPQRFFPAKEFIEYHNKYIFKDH